MLLSINTKFSKESNAVSEEQYYLDLAKKDAKQFRYFYDKHYKAIYSFIYRRVQDEETTRDISSQTFLKALQSLHKFNYTGIPFSAFLYRIATNEITDYFRHNTKTRTVNIDDVHDMDELLDGNSSADQEIKINALERALKKLNEEELLLIEMRFFEKLSFKEIGDIKNWNDHNAKMKTYRVIEKLKEFIANELKTKEAI